MNLFKIKKNEEKSRLA